MSLRESSEPPVTWPLWTIALGLGLIIVSLAPHYLVARNNRTAPAASVSGNTSLAQIAPKKQADEPIALVGGTIYVNPTDDPIRDGVILIRGGKIAAVGRKASLEVPPGIQTLDCSGLTITAGFWNSHVHFMERKWADAAKIPAPELSGQLQGMLTQYGFTSVVDTGSMWANTRLLRDRIESGEIPGPRIRSTGEILMPKGGLKGSPPSLLDALGFMTAPLPEVADATEALAASKKLLDAGTDGIKVYAATWFAPFVALPQSAIEAAAKEAHSRGKLVFAHPTNREGLLAAVRGGVDVVVHTTPQSGPWDETVMAEMKDRGVALIPTLKLWKYELRHDRTSARDKFVEAGVLQLRAWHAYGGVVLFGTDVGYMNDYDPSDEYALMAQAGLDFRQILASLTVTPADRFGESKQRGRIVPLLAADFVVLNQDPSRNVRAFADVRYTLRDGKVIHRASDVARRDAATLPTTPTAPEHR
jgi:imidazolonepropionase-like amidohydrolase